MFLVEGVGCLLKIFFALVLKWKVTALSFMSEEQEYLCILNQH